jgi:hypothetical protein
MTPADAAKEMFKFFADDSLDDEALYIAMGELRDRVGAEAFKLAPSSLDRKMQAGLRHHGCVGSV